MASCDIVINLVPFWWWNTAQNSLCSGNWRRPNMQHEPHYVRWGHMCGVDNVSFPVSFYSAILVTHLASVDGRSGSTKQWCMPHVFIQCLDILRSQDNRCNRWKVLGNLHRHRKTWRRQWTNWNYIKYAEIASWKIYNQLLFQILFWY